MCLYIIKGFFCINMLKTPLLSNVLNLVHASRKDKWMEIRKAYRASILPGLVMTCFIAQFGSLSCGLFCGTRKVYKQHCYSSLEGTVPFGSLVFFCTVSSSKEAKSSCCWGVCEQLFHCLYIEVKHLAEHFPYPASRKSVPHILISLFRLLLKKLFTKNLEWLLQVP